MRVPSLQFLALALSLSGCAGISPPTQFYTLADPGAVSSPVAPASVRSNAAIGVGPLRLPAMLDRPQIVTRKDDNRVDLAEFHRWAGELDGALQPDLRLDVSG